jgi:hypothetical protein
LWFVSHLGGRVCTTSGSGPALVRPKLTTAGTVAVVNNVLIGACTSLAVEVLPMASFVMALVAGASAGAATLSAHRRHHRRATDAYTPEAVDRAAIVVSPPEGEL